MYADRYARPEGIKPGSLTVAIGINAAIIGALMFSAPIVTGITGEKPFEAINIPIDSPPDPLPPEVKAQPQQPTKAQPTRIEATTATGATSGFTVIPLPPLPPLPLPDEGAGTTIVDPPLPVLTGAAPDPRFARDLQPPYPPGERRAEREGTASLRIVIGTDGRVRSAECVAADSDGFCPASRDQALKKWRFRPATRDAVPIEETRVMTVRFRLER